MKQNIWRNEQVAKEFKITSARLKELEEELNYLKTTREKEVAELIKEARSFGDLSENSEYDEAKNEQAKVEAEIADLTVMLQNAEIIDESKLDSDTVSLGSVVRVEIVTARGSKEKEYQILGSNESDPRAGKISEDSPVGKALLGCKLGDEVEVTTPAGVSTYRILEISR
jgi:transcription elongation factor GreA